MTITTRAHLAGLILLRLLATASTASAEPLSPHEDGGIVAINDNRHAAGSLADNVLTLRLRAADGRWKPEGDAGPELRVEAFGEEGRVLQIPAPLIRVAAGTTIVASVRNELAAPLRVHGLCTRDTPRQAAVALAEAGCAPLEIAPQETRETRFTASVAGTYHYWATSTGMPLPFRGATDTQLSGAFIVDTPADREPDRVLVLTEWTSLTIEQLRHLATLDDPTAAFFALGLKVTFLINGLAWPATEQLSYDLGERVRWRVVNLSSQSHPMHLHGFYFDVDSLGDGMRDQPFATGQAPRVVTQLLRPGSTMRMTWVPERPGNWTFHCHVAFHIAPERRLTAPPATAHADHASHANHTPDTAGMAGMVLGVSVRGPADAGETTPLTPSRKLTLTMATEPKRYGANAAYGFALSEGAGGSEDPPLREQSHGLADSSTSNPAGRPERAMVRLKADPTTDTAISIPGPPIVLQRGEPVEIALVNRLPEPTSIHWHGIELDSYYDGVHGWSGTGTRRTPLIAPGATFTVRFTPPRAGTFIYHTHMHDDHQLTSGMYGALLVLEPGETFNAARDHVVVIGKGGPGRDAPTIVNGVSSPQLSWQAGVSHRVRVINITADDTFVVSLGTPDGPATWKPLTKDGAPVPAGRDTPTRATQLITVGETYDFQYDAPPGRASLWLEVRTPAGRWQTQGRVTIK